MKTYQDLLKVTNEADIPDFVLNVISEYKNSKQYKDAVTAEAYARQENPTIINYEKFLYTVRGEAVKDDISANHKLASNYYNRFNLQENQYLLANGVTFGNDATKKKLGTKKKSFDTQIQKAGKKALTHGIAYGLYNVDHIDIFEALEYAPLEDEEDGAMKAGVRFWQLSSDKPLRATLYEMDGYTDFIRRKGEEMQILAEKRPYMYSTRYSKADGLELYNGENYEGFPIVPLWGNQDHMCRIRAWRRKIDCYDLISSGFCNDIDDASLIYWCIENAGGMDDVDLAEFIQRMKTLHAVVLEDAGARATPHTQDIPVEARNVCLERLERDLYKDAMALDTDAIAKGNTVATAIRAAYESLNEKTDDFEYCVIEFIQGILELAGIDDDPTFKRSTIVNQTEETQMVLSAAQFLDKETVLNHLPFLSPDEIPDIIERTTREEAERTALAVQQAATQEEPQEEPQEE